MFKHSLLALTLSLSVAGTASATTEPLSRDKPLYNFSCHEFGFFKRLHVLRHQLLYQKWLDRSLVYRDLVLYVEKRKFELQDEFNRPIKEIVEMIDIMPEEDRGSVREFLDHQEQYLFMKKEMDIIEAERRRTIDLMRDADGYYASSAKYPCHRPKKEKALKRVRETIEKLTDIHDYNFFFRVLSGNYKILAYGTDPEFPAIREHWIEQAKEEIALLRSFFLDYPSKVSPLHKRPSEQDFDANFSYLNIVN